MIRKMLHQSVLSALIIAVLAGSYAVTLGGGLDASHSESHDRWDR
jgi:hypothetical protein